MEETVPNRDFKKVKKIVHRINGHTCYLGPDPNGNMVQYSDYMGVCVELDQCRKERDALKRELPKCRICGNDVIIKPFQQIAMGPWWYHKSCFDLDCLKRRHKECMKERDAKYSIEQIEEAVFQSEANPTIRENWEQIKEYLTTKQNKSEGDSKDG